MKPDKKQEKEDLEPQQEQSDQQEQTETQPAVSQEAQTELTLEQELEAQLKREQDNYLRLAAEYDNFRKRSQKERDNLYTEIRAEIVGKFLPVYDNLERALLVETSDEAYKKGVEMTMTGLTEVMQKLGVESFGQPGDVFDPNLHNAVMHVEDDAAQENTIVEVFQKGFRVEDKMIRFAMVKVAN